MPARSPDSSIPTPAPPNKRPLLNGPPRPCAAGNLQHGVFTLEKHFTLFEGSTWKELPEEVAQDGGRKARSVASYTTSHK